MKHIPYLTHSIYPIMAGDMAPPFFCIDPNGNHCVLWGFAGQPVALFFTPPITSPASETLLVNLAQYQQAFAQAGFAIIVITLEPASSVTHLPYPVLSADGLLGRNTSGLEVLMQYGLLRKTDGTPDNAGFSPMTFIIDENSRIKKIVPLPTSARSLEHLLKDMQTMLPLRESQEVTSQAPVLFIDNVLSKAECDHLIDIWHEQGNVDSGSMHTVDGKTVGVYDYNIKIRRDHFITDPALLKHLDITMRRRVFPQIKKAFHFECSLREDYKIACYDAERGGYFRKHRDNVTAATAHRVWAMSLNLNSDDYEGGHVRFPEFSNHLYKPKTGSALIFSGSMMHEATDVRRGKRFVLLQFFYGEKEGKIRDNNRHLLMEEKEG